MRTCKNALIAALAATALLAALAGAASANHLSSSETNFRVTYSPMTFEGGGRIVRCNVTLEGSFHERTIAKTAEALIGYVTRASVASCNPANGARANTETLPWHVHYISFEGTLPSITGITQALHNSSFEVQGEIFGFRVNCRYTPALQKAINNRETRGAVRTQSIVVESAASETSGCPSGSLSGTGAVSTPTGGTISVTLI